MISVHRRDPHRLSRAKLNLRRRPQQQWAQDALQVPVGGEAGLEDGAGEIEAVEAALEAQEEAARGRGAVDEGAAVGEEAAQVVRVDVC